MEHTQQSTYHKTPEDCYLQITSPEKKIKTGKERLLSLMCLTDFEKLDSIMTKMKGEECSLTFHITSPP
jgi:hypothetical protein